MHRFARSICLLISGVHTIDGKLVEANRTLGVGNNGFVAFPQAFAVPPVVVLFADTTGGNQGTTLRLTNVLTVGFQIYTDSATDLNWIAFTPGDYVHGNLHLRAGAFATPASCPNNVCTANFVPALPFLPGMVTTLYDGSAALGLGNGNVFHTGMSPTQYQWHLNVIDASFVDYVAFWKD